MHMYFMPLFYPFYSLKVVKTNVASCVILCETKLARYHLEVSELSLITVPV